MMILPHKPMVFNNCNTPAPGQNRTSG